MKTYYFTFAIYDSNDNLLKSFFRTVDITRTNVVKEELLKYWESAHAVRFFLKDKSIIYSNTQEIVFKGHFIASTLNQIVKGDYNPPFLLNPTNGIEGYVL